MLRIVYVSSATVPFDDVALAALLEQSRVSNARDGVTGVLLHADSNFVQVIEGEAAAVRSLHARIRRDPRHHRVLDVLEETTNERLCPDWAMGFIPTDRLREPVVAAFSPLLLPRGDANRLATMRGTARIALDTFMQSVR